MPFKYPRTFNSKKYPKFFRESIILKTFQKPDKVFARIGLPNSESSLESIIIGDCVEKAHFILSALPLDIDANDYKFYDAIGELLRQLECCIDNDEKFIIDDWHEELKIFSLKRKDNIKTILTKVKKYCIKNKINCKAFDGNVKNLTAAQRLKLKGKKYKLCFSSNGPKGHWDIATMSMRKIRSCMRWSNANSSSLVGSVTDPYAGIIYITDGTNTKYGTGMIARAVVRFIICNNKPALFLEPIYYSVRAEDELYGSIFKLFLKSKTKMEAFSSNDNYYNRDIFVPITKSIDTIINNYGKYDSGGHLSYSDGEIPYRNRKKLYDSKKINKRFIQKALSK